MAKNEKIRHGLTSKVSESVLLDSSTGAEIFCVSFTLGVGGSFGVDENLEGKSDALSSHINIAADIFGKHNFENARTISMVEPEGRNKQARPVEPRLMQVKLNWSSRFQRSTFLENFRALAGLKENLDQTVP